MQMNPNRTYLDCHGQASSSRVLRRSREIVSTRATVPPTNPARSRSATLLILMTWNDGTEGGEKVCEEPPPGNWQISNARAFDGLPIDRSCLARSSFSVCDSMSPSPSPSLSIPLMRSVDRRSERADERESERERERGESMGSGVNLPNDAASHITLGCAARVTSSDIIVASSVRCA